MDIGNAGTGIAASQGAVDVERQSVTFADTGDRALDGDVIPAVAVFVNLGHDPAGRCRARHADREEISVRGCGAVANQVEEPRGLAGIDPERYGEIPSVT